MKSAPAQPTAAQQFGRRLRQLRREKSANEERDVEQGEVATAVGETQPNLARYERGRIPKDEAVTKRLAGYYGVEYAWLRLGEGQRTPAPTMPNLRPMPRPGPVAEDAKPAAKKTQGKGR